MKIIIKYRKFIVIKFSAHTPFQSIAIRAPYVARDATAWASIIIDGQIKGGYLIRSFSKILSKDDIFLKKDFDKIIKHVRIMEDKLMGKSIHTSTQIVEWYYSV